MGDWLRDKTISWNSARRRLLQTNAGTFPCETRLQKWGKHPDGICGLCKRSREMVLKLLVGRPARGTTGHLQSSVCRQGTGQSRSVSKEWDFVSKGTEISFGKFVSEHFTLLTLDIQTGVVSNEDTAEIWETTKKDTRDKVRRKNRSARAESPMTDEEEVEKYF